MKDVGRFSNRLWPYPHQKNLFIFFIFLDFAASKHRIPKDHFVDPHPSDPQRMLSCPKPHHQHSGARRGRLAYMEAMLSAD